MKAIITLLSHRSLRAGLCIFLPYLLAAPAAHGGLTVNLLMYHTVAGVSASDGYDCDAYLTTNSTPPDAPLGYYVMSSPTNAWHTEYQFTGASFSTVLNLGHYYSDFDSFIQQVTNGDWTITVTNATSTNVYVFTVSATGFTSNVFSAPVVVSFPTNGAVNVTNQPTFTWQGPSPWAGDLQVEEDNGDDSFFESDDLPPAQTSWPTPATLPAGGYTFFVGYTSNASPIIVASTPTNTVTAAPISGWASTATLETYQFIEFSVSSSSGGSGGHTLVAHYSFDDGNLEATDVSGNGNGLGDPYSYGGASATITNDALAGAYAVDFNNNGGSGAAYYYSSNPNLLSALEGSFSASLWLKTTQISGSDTDDGFYGNAGIVSTFYQTVVPMALTGSKLAFVTDSASQDTLHSASSINGGEYIHVVVTRDQVTGQKIIYINGALDASDVAETGLLSDPDELDIGNDNGTGFNGEMDDIQIYTGVLSASEVLQLYNNPGTTIANTTGGGDLGTALNATNLTWATGGDADWFVESGTTHDGVAAAQSGSITDSQTDWIETTVPSDGQVSFQWKVSSEQDFDYLTFYINGVPQDAISGEVDWNQETYSVSALDTLRWEYSKDDSNSEGQDTGWLDQVQYTTETAGPVTATLNLVLVRREDFHFGYHDYYAIPELTSISPIPATTNRVESSDGQIFGEVYTGHSSWDNATSADYSTLDQLIQACTNGQWTLYINKGDPSEQQFHFNVSISGLDTNLLSPIIVNVPALNATDVATNTPFQWSGPVGFSSIFVNAYQLPSFASAGYANLPGSATNWPSPPTLPYGTNGFTVICTSNNFSNVTFSTPVDDSMNPISSWSTEVDLQSVTEIPFVVGAPAPLPVQLTGLPPQTGGGNFQFSFQTLAGRPHTIQVRTNLTGGAWVDVTNFIGDGSTQQFTFPTTNTLGGFFRVITQ